MRRLITAMLAAFLVATALAPAASAAPESVSDKVGPSIIFIKTTYKAYVQIPFVSGDRWTTQMTVMTSCTGYAVDTKGTIATAGHCVNGSDDDILNEFRKRAVLASAESFNWTEAKASDVYDLAVKDKWTVSGSTSGESTPERTVDVQQSSGPGQVLTNWVSATVVDFQKFADGDNAVLRISGYTLAPLEISTTEPKPGDKITAVGYPGAVRVITDTSTIPQPSYKDGSVSSRQQTGNNVTKTEISAGMGHGMSGGPTVDADGKVVGTNSSVTKDETASFDFITDNIALRSYLESHGADLASAKSASAVSSATMWLWLGPLIAVIVLVLVVILVLVIVRSRKKTVPAGYSQQNAFGAPQHFNGPGQQFGGQFGGAMSPGPNAGQPHYGGPRPGGFGPGGAAPMPRAGQYPHGGPGQLPPQSPGPQRSPTPQQNPAPQQFAPRPPDNRGPYPPNPFR